MKKFAGLTLVLVLLLALLPLPAVDAQGGSTLTIYSGRNENLIGPLIEQFEEDTGIEVEVRYGDSAELALQLIEEGENSPADIFFAQDAGSLGAVANADLFDELSEDILDLVEPRFRSEDGLWIGLSGRARVFVYNTEALSEEDLPASILDFTAEEWSGRLGWAPTNGSFQAFVTALRLTEGEEAAEAWINGILENDAQVYPDNTSIVAATASGEIDGGFVNHYYAYRLLSEDPDAPVANYFFPDGDLGSIINVAGAGILDSSENKILAQRFLLYALSLRGQQYFVDNTFEYPLLRFGEFELPQNLPPLEEIETPVLDLSALDDLQTTLDLLESTGALTSE
ncbi:MAG: iron ABC transporter substrate-binding protein [Chloroflexi bacterium]|nr:iron ABC transporter substrate-binding protein [Chloroflexota bacterium]